MSSNNVTESMVNILVGGDGNEYRFEIRKRGREVEELIGCRT